MKSSHELSILAFCSAMLFSQCSAEKALWIEVKEDGKRTTTIAMTEGICRRLLETKEMKFNFSDKGGRDLVTRDMVRSLLDGRERAVTVCDENGSETVLSMKSLSIPGKKAGSDRLVLETYKSGNQTFRIVLPELDMEQTDEKGDQYVMVNLGWKSLLPFLAELGGAVYINDRDDDTEVWIYVE